MVIFYSYVSLPEGICRFKSPSRRLAPAVAPRRLPSMPSPVYDLGRRRRKEQPGALPDDHKNCGFLWSLRLTWWIFGKILDILVKTCKDPKKMNPKKHIPGLQLKMKPVEFWKMQQLFLKAGRWGAKVSDLSCQVVNQSYKCAPWLCNRIYVPIRADSDARSDGKFWQPDSCVVRHHPALVDQVIPGWYHGNIHYSLPHRIHVCYIW